MRGILTYGMMPRMRGIAALVLGWWCVSQAPAWAVNVERLEEADQQRLDALLQRLQPLIDQRRARGTLPVMSFQDLYVPLTSDQRELLDAIRAIAPETLGGSSRRLPPPSPYENFVRIDGQMIRFREETKTLHPEYLPRPVFKAYRVMMQAMQRDLGRRLFVESGYRSPAHQLYLFCFYLPKHHYSIQDTNRYVALPGCSEHGSPARQAIDFINADGINGEDHPEEFEVLPEYAWLQQHARRYGFHLSYPRNNPLNTSFEPWHWHYEDENAIAAAGG